ncbi:MAG: WXG100 family type VII secretion target [Blautia sp.]|nr:WXG100 family type VII secretion target [Lachnoclostridium sp.]MCM1212682.1 WXG100 family type VII secretion target [Blautia sp.]
MEGNGSIRMSPEELEAEAVRFEKNKEEFEQVVNDMGSHVTSLCQTWEGASSQAFAEQFEQLKPGFTATSELLADIAQQLRSISAAMVDADMQIAKQLGVH